MDKFIEYYYNFLNIKSSKKNECYSFMYNNESYIFCPLTRSKKEMDEIILLTKWNKFMDKIILNINNDYITQIYNSNYILIKHNSNIYMDGYKYLLLKKSNQVGIYNSDKSNWLELWSKKVDNIEHIVNQTNRKYGIINNSINYYIGMAETAIAYIRNIFDSNKYFGKKVISHIRMTDSDIFNPQNLIIDYEGRDVSEYLKYIYFYKNDICFKIAENIFEYCSFNYFSLQIIYGRLFFPTFYFDMFDAINNGNLSETSLNFLIKNVEEYEQYINYIYTLICKQKKIPKVLWI